MSSEGRRRTLSWKKCLRLARVATKSDESAGRFWLRCWKWRGYAGAHAATRTWKSSEDYRMLIDAMVGLRMDRERCSGFQLDFGERCVVGTLVRTWWC